MNSPHSKLSGSKPLLMCLILFATIGTSYKLTAAQIEIDPQANLVRVIASKVEVDSATNNLFGDRFIPSNGLITSSTIDVSLFGNFYIPVELGRWVLSEDYDTGGPTGWAWNSREDHKDILGNPVLETNKEGKVQ